MQVHQDTHFRVLYVQHCIGCIATYDYEDGGSYGHCYECDQHSANPETGECWHHQHWEPCYLCGTNYEVPDAYDDHGDVPTCPACGYTCETDLPGSWAA